MIKKLLLILMLNSIYTICFCQHTVLLQGPYKPKSKYQNTVWSEHLLDIKPEGDSTLVEEGMPRKLFRPIMERDTFSSNAIVSTGRLNKTKEYPIVMEVHLPGNNVSNFPTVILYGAAHEDSIPQMDSIEFIPKNASLNNMYKEQSLQLFKNAFHYLNPPHYFFHIGDTISTNTIIPSGLLGIRLYYNISTNYKLIAVKKNIAYFDLKYIVRIKFPNSQAVIVNGQGSGSGTGSFTYHIKRHYFLYNETFMNTNTIMQVYNPANNLYIKFLINEKAHSVVAFRQIK
ncbi:MAG: hypothetical protein PW786_02585 [Arachidicoccus sp.]|nr:hypothetical protein [Arachidicoccus sp.]